MTTRSPDIVADLLAFREYAGGNARTTQRGTDMIARERWQIRTIVVLENVFEERLRQVAKYGHNEDLQFGTGPDVQWLPEDPDRAVRIELIFRRDYEKHEARNGKPTWMHLIREEVAEAFKESDPDRLEAELTQVAALCVSWIEKIRAERDEEAIV